MKARKPRKELSTPILVILTLIFIVLLLVYGISIGFVINSILNPLVIDLQMSILLFLIIGILYFALFIRLMCNSDSENVEPLKWYINNVLISFVVLLILAGITVFISGNDYNNDLNYLVGFLIFPFIGIITTPNIIKYSLKETEKWKWILYDKGNLHQIKNSNDFYRVETPLPIEKKLIKAIYKNHFLNMLCIFGIMIFIMYCGIHYMISDHSFTENVIYNIALMRAKRSFGLVGFLMIIISAFGIPIYAYFITTNIKRVKMVRNNKYLAYHVIATSVNNSKLSIYHNKVHYVYEYCTCVGIKEKDVNQTSAILVFVPDDVYLFPDNNEFVLTKYK